MDSLSNLLLNYKIPGVRIAQIRHICAQELTKLLGCPISASKIQYKQETLFIQVPPILKSALHIKKDALIERLSAHDIKVVNVR
jgi:hypothetical protein